MANFFDETKAIMETHGKEPKDITFIGSRDGEFGLNPNDFPIMANFRYDSGYGSAEIPEDLVVVFSDGTWLERGEYDGSEWWEYKECPKVPNTYTLIETLHDGDRWRRGPYLIEVDDDLD